MIFWRFNSIVAALISGSFLLALPSFSWGQTLEDMNKSELREFAAACERDRAELRAGIEALNNELSQTKTNLLNQIVKLESDLTQQETNYRNQLRNQTLEHEAQELALSQILQSKSTYIGELQSGLLSNNDQGVTKVPVNNSTSPKSYFLTSRQNGVEFGDHELQFELIGIHVKKTVIPTQSRTESYGEEETLGNLYERSEFYIRFLKPMEYNPGVVLNSAKGRKIVDREFDFPLYAASWTDDPEFSDLMSIRADVLRGKLVTFSFGNRVTSDFFLSGVGAGEKSWNSSANRTVLKLVNSEEEGIELDMVEWNEEHVLAITPDALKELGADFSFGKNAKSEVDILLNGNKTRDLNRDWEWLVRYYGDDNISARVEVGKMEFFLPCSECEEGSYPVEPNFLLFRVIEGSDVSEIPESEPMDEEDSASAAPSRVSITEAETMPYISNCGEAKPIQNLQCFELELLSLVKENIKYPPIARDAGIQGVVTVSFVLTSGGNIQDVRVLQPVDARLDAEAVSVLSRISDSVTIEPATIGGEAVDVEMCLPVPFTLR